MKSNICALTGRQDQLDAVLAEVEKCTAYNNLDKKSSLRVRLLAEELVSMLPALLENTEGNFWIENKDRSYELHVSLHARQFKLGTREKLIAVSTSGKNSAAAGIMGKIRAAAEIMLFPSEEVADAMDFFNYGLESGATLDHVWSMQHYIYKVRTEAEKEAKAEAWDELEKSIIAKLADDVVVGIKGKQVDIVVRKEFA